MKFLCGLWFVVTSVMYTVVGITMILQPKLVIVPRVGGLLIISAVSMFAVGMYLVLLQWVKYYD